MLKHRPTLHLLSGLPCSGKTTFAKKLATEIKALHLCLDDHLFAMHGAYSIEEIGVDSHKERVLRSCDALWNIALTSFAIGVDVIFDHGLFLKETRQKYKNMCEKVSAHPKLYYFDCSETMILERLAERNATKGISNFIINKELLSTFKSIYEVPSQDEGIEMVIIR